MLPPGRKHKPIIAGLCVRHICTVPEDAKEATFLGPKGRGRAGRGATELPGEKA